MQRRLTDGRISLYLEYYLGRMTEPMLDKDGKQVTYSSGKMAGKPKYRVRHRRKKESLDLFLSDKPKSAEERRHNKETIIMAERIRYEREMVFKENRYGYRFQRERNYDFHTLFKYYIERYTKRDIEVMKLSYKRFMEFLRVKHPEYETCMQMDCITKDIVTEYLECLQKKSVGEGAHSIFNRFKKFMLWATEHGYILHNPCHKVVCIIDHNVLRKEILSEDEIRLLAGTRYPKANPDVIRAFLFCLYTGMRFCDVKELTFRNIDTGNMQLKFIQRKTEGHSSASGVVVPLTASTIKLTGASEGSNHPDDLVFHLPPYDCCRYQIQKWVEKAGISKHISWHCARHSFAVMALNHGANIKTVSSLLGHSSIKTTEKYTRAIDQLKVDAINSLPHIDFN